MSEQDLCPCGSNQPLAQCCGPYLAGEQLPATAEALMRSRYTAYTLQDDNYLLETWHPNTRPDDPHPSNDGDGSVWTGLNIVRTEQGQAGDSEGVVEFVARCDIKGTPAQLHEISSRCGARNPRSGATIPAPVAAARNIRSVVGLKPQCRQKPALWERTCSRMLYPPSEWC